MLNLFERYHEMERDLEYSLKTSGYRNPTIVLQDDGYLPEHIESPFQFFAQSRKGDKGLPLFFNELKLPAHWEIQGSNTEANIFEGYKQRGKIHYSKRKEDFRCIQSVEWWNDFGKCRAIDLYNQYGQKFGHQTYSDGDLTLSTYYDGEGREVIVQNHIVGTIQLYYNHKTYLFDTYSSFILFYFKVAKIDSKQIIYNSLGLPYFITLALERENPEKAYHHVLFWQESSSEMPGNMKGLLQDKEKPSTQKIIVQDQAEYERLREQVNFKTTVSMDYLGWLYPYQTRAAFTPSLFILTNSDQVEHLEALSQGLPGYDFHIAARTEMSSKLMAFGNHPNISLYPNVTTEEINALLKTTSVYLDINQGGEVEHIIRQAFEHEQLILGFRETLHDSRLIAPSFVFEKKEVEQMVKFLQALTQSTRRFNQALAHQKACAGQETITNYQKVIHHA